MRTENASILDKMDSVDMSGDCFSAAISVEHIYGYSVTAQWTGSPVGSLRLQASNDPYQNAQADLVSNWEDVSGSSIDPSAVASGQQVWNVERAFYRWFRLAYTSSSGSGTLTRADIMLKGV